MKFGVKMTLAVTILLAVALSVAGTVLVRQNFNDSLQAAIEQSISQHFMERYALEAELSGASGNHTNEGLVRYGTTQSDYLREDRKMTAYFDDEAYQIYTNFPAHVPTADRVALLQADTQGYVLREYNGQVVMLMASHLENPRRSIWLVSGYDMTRIFTQRNAQMRNLWRIGGIVLLVSSAVVAGLSHLLTRPIRRLNRAARRIAGGAYAVRTGVHTGDEIGELARNFDAMAAAVQQKVEALNQSLQQRDDFVSAFTHELKTPMTSIIGYSDILRSMESDAKTRHTAANHIFHEARRLEVLSQQLLSLMGLSQQELVLGPVKLASVFAATYRSLKPLPQDIELEFDPCNELLVAADKDLAVDLLRNLILNAIKAQPKDGRVQVLLQPQDNRCRITVYDTGCGIPPEELGRITEPFYMVDKSRARAQGGTGVGLALCQRIAALHGGSLHFKSKLGAGTAVSFTLAIWQEEEA